jgi:hypothetical protein
MKLFFSKGHRNSSIISVFIMSIGFMVVTTYGSLNPADLGFWLSILSAIFTQFVVNYVLVKFADKKP